MSDLVILRLDVTSGSSSSSSGGGGGGGSSSSSSSVVVRGMCCAIIILALPLGACAMPASRLKAQSGYFLGNKFLAHSNPHAL